MAYGEHWAPQPAGNRRGSRNFLFEYPLAGGFDMAKSPRQLIAEYLFTHICSSLFLPTSIPYGKIASSLFPFSLNCLTKIANVIL